MSKGEHPALYNIISQNSQRNSPRVCRNVLVRWFAPRCVRALWMNNYEQRVHTKLKLNLLKSTAVYCS